MRGRLLKLGLPTLAVLAVAVGAWAYWSTGGSGSASANVGTFTAPTITSATPGAGTVALSWSGVTPPGSGSVAYYVTRDGGSAGTACPSSSSPSSVTSCTDAGVSAGDHTYTVTAVWRTWTATSASASVHLASGPASQIVLSGLTSSLTSGSTRTFTATIEDSAGNTVASGADSGATVTFSQTGGSGSVTGTGAATASNGVATKTVTGALAGTVSIQASATLGASATSSNTISFTVTTGSAAKLAFTQQPGGATGGSAFVTQPKVAVQDAAGNNVTGDSSTVTLTITTGTPSSGGPGNLSGCSQTESGGVITFSGCKIDTAGTGYKLHAVDGSLTATDSSALDVTVGSPAQLVFTQQPSGATGGTAFTTQPKVTVQDAGGNTVTGDSSTVTLGATGGPGTLSGCSQTETNGVVSFSGCKIDTAGTGYKLHATDGTLTSTDSASFSVTVGPAAQLAFTQQPAGATGGVAFTTQPKVTIQDAGGNTVTSDSSTVTLTATVGPGTLSGCSQSEAGGVVSFSGCKINTVGTGYKLHATDGLLAAADSSAFNVTVGSAAQVAFTQQPAGASAGNAFTTQPKVAIQDAGGNTVTTDSSTVTLAIVSGTGTTGAALSGCTQTQTSGVVTFSGCKIDTAGTGYKLRASDGSLTTADSNAFDVAGITATLLGSVLDTAANTSQSSVASVTTNSGKTELILVYREGSSNDTISGITGPFSGAPAEVATKQDYLNKHTLWVWRATGNGTTGTVTVNFGSGSKNTVTVIDVVQLSGNDTSSPLVLPAATATANNSTATATLTSPAAGDAEVVIVGATANLSVSTPSGFSQLDFRSGSTGSGFGVKSVFSPIAQASTSFTLGSPAQANQWGTIAVEVKHA